MSVNFSNFDKQDSVLAQNFDSCDVIMKFNILTFNYIYISRIQYKFSSARGKY